MNSKIPALATLDAAAMPVQSFLKHYRHEFEHYVEHGRSILDSKSDATVA